MEMVSGSGPANDEGSMRLSIARSYGTFAAGVEGRRGKFMHILVLAIVFMTAATASAQTSATGPTKPIKMVVLGDSLSAGLGLSAASAFPARLQKSLKINGIDVDMINAGVSGDTSSGGRDRLDWSVPEGTDAVILELGANDMLRGIDPQLTRHALEEIVRRLTQRHVVVLLAGMRAAANFDSKYRRDFDAIYPELAVRYDLLLYPFFLDGIVGEGALNQGDGLHPSAAGVDAIVVRILPTVEELVRQARSRGAR